MLASGAQEEKKMPKGHHWKNTRARDPLGWGGEQCVRIQGARECCRPVARAQSTKPQPLCGEGSLTALRKQGWRETAKA